MNDSGLLTDLELFNRWRLKGDVCAFESVVDRHLGAVQRTCMAILHNAGEAEEITQECLLKLVDADLKEGVPLELWLKRVARTQSINRLSSEKQRRRREARYVEERPVAGIDTPDDVNLYLKEALSELDRKYRLPLILHFFNGASHEQIAIAMGAPRTTISARLHRGLEMLRKSLGQRGVDLSFDRYQ